MKRFSQAVAFLALTLLVPLTVAAAKVPHNKKHAKIRAMVGPLGKLEPLDLIVVDGLDYPVPRNINRRPGILPTRSAKANKRQPAQEVYTAVDPTQ